jgi:hypothetical protein
LATSQLRALRSEDDNGARNIAVAASWSGSKTTGTAAEQLVKIIMKTETVANFKAGKVTRSYEYIDISIWRKKVLGRH